MKTDIDYQDDKSNKKYFIIGIIIALIIIVVVVILILNKNTKIQLDEGNLCIPNTYDGTEKKLVNADNNEEFTIADNIATDAGEYTITLNANDGYIFQDRKKEKKVVCTINKATTVINTDKENLSINRDSQVSLAIDTNLEGTISLNIANNIASIKGDKQINKTLEKITIKIEGNYQGDTSLEIVFTPSNQNYETTTKSIPISVSSSKKINIPTSSICNKVTYNGKTQKLVSKTDYEGYTLKGQLEGTNVGNYKIEAVLKQGYVWSDNQSSNKTITCTINQARIYKMKSDTANCIAGETTYITITKDENAPSPMEITAKNINNNINLTKITKKETCSASYYKGPSDANNIGIAAQCIYPGRYEVNCLKPGNDTINFTMDNGEVVTAKITISSGETITLGTNSTQYTGINCVKNKNVTITANGYKDGVRSSIIKNYSVENTNIATVSKSSNQPSCLGCINLTIKCVKSGDTNLVINTNNGTTKKFPIGYFK